VAAGVCPPPSDDGDKNFNNNKYNDCVGNYFKSSQNYYNILIFILRRKNSEFDKLIIFY